MQTSIIKPDYANNSVGDKYLGEALNMVFK